MNRETLRQLKKALFDGLDRRLRNHARRAVIALVNDALKAQKVQLDILGEETREFERFAEYGFTSNPPAGAEAVLIRFTPGHGIVIATEDRRYRIKVAAGEVALYDTQGQKVHLKGAGVVEVKANTKVLATAPLVETTGNLHVGGNITCAGNVSDSAGSMATIRTGVNAHLHTNPEGGNVGPSTPAL